jgi:hypothetical protein
LEEGKTAKAIEAAPIIESQNHLQLNERESLYEQRVSSNDNIKSLVKTKRVSKIKMAEV